jgi:hypothetical protein
MTSVSTGDGSSVFIQEIQAKYILTTLVAAEVICCKHLLIILEAGYRPENRSRGSQGFQDTPSFTGGRDSIRQLSQATHFKAEVIVKAAPVAKAPAASPMIEIQDLCSKLCDCTPDVTYLGYLTGDEQQSHDLWKEEDQQPPSQTTCLISLESLLMGQDGLRLSRLERFKLTSILASSLLQL